MSDKDGDISKFDGGVSENYVGAVLGEKREEEWAEDTPLWCTSVQDESGECPLVHLCGVPVKQLRWQP